MWVLRLLVELNRFPQSAQECGFSPATTTTVEDVTS
jgi:hypothetical protein